MPWPEGDLSERHHLYRSLDVLTDAKDDMEVRRPERVRHLFNQELDLIVYGTTSLYFQSAEQDALRRSGHSRNRRPDLPRALLGLLFSGDGLPICHELFAGNIVPEVPDRLRERFGPRWLIFVGDRGMVNDKNLEPQNVAAAKESLWRAE